MSHRLWPVLLTGLVTLAGCGGAGVDRVELTDLDFQRGRISLSLTPPVRLTRVEAGRVGEPLQRSLPWPDEPADRVDVDVPWRTGERWQIVLRDDSGRRWTREGVAPTVSTADFELAFVLPAAPRPGKEAQFAAFAAGTTVDGFVRLLSLRDGPQDVYLHLDSADLMDRATPAGWTATAGGGWERTVTLADRGELWFTPIRLRLPADAAAPPQKVVVTGSTANIPRAEALRREWTLQSADASQLGLRIELVDITLPTDGAGNRDPRWQPDVLHLPGQAGVELLRWCGVRFPVADPYEPFTYQAIRLRNRGALPVPLLFRARVTETNRDTTAATLSAPAHSSGGSGASLAMVEVPAGKDATVVLPVFVHLARVEEGRYRREIRAFVMGTDEAVLAVDLPLEVRRTGSLAWFSVLGSLLTAALLAVALAWAGPAFWRRFRLRELVLIALFGSVSFAAITLPGSLVTSVFSAVLGPLATVITGLIGRVFGYGILGALLVLVPRPGAAGLATTVKWMLSAVFFGLVNATALLYLAVYVVLVESALWLGGVTRGQAPTGLRALGAAALVGAADALATFVDFQITVLLYRVYFADWYVLLTVVLNGFVYTTLGLCMGLNLGRDLRRVA